MKRIILILLLICPHLALAQNAPLPGDWIVRIGAAQVGVAETARFYFTPQSGLGSHDFELKDAYGLSLSGEYMLTPEIGLEGTTILSNVEADITFAADKNEPETSSGTPGFYAVLAGMNLYALDRPPFVISAGAFVGRLFLKQQTYHASHLQSGQMEPIAIDVAFVSDFVYGLKLGIDVPISQSGWMAALQVRAMAYRYDLDAAAQVPPQTLVAHDFYDNVTTISLGVGKTF